MHVEDVNLVMELEALSFAIDAVGGGSGVTRPQEAVTLAGIVRWSGPWCVGCTGGPAHTLDLARDILGLKGHAGASSAAVFQLLLRGPTIPGGPGRSVDPRSRG